MNLKNRIILEDYRKQRDSFVKLGDVVHEILEDIVDSMGITVLGIEHRVKSEKSLAGKLERNADWYSAFEDLTDILGARVICFFSDEIDKIGKKVEEAFVIDWENSSDKRALIKRIHLAIFRFITFAHCLLGISGRTKFAGRDLKYR